MQLSQQPFGKKLLLCILPSSHSGNPHPSHHHQSRRTIIHKKQQPTKKRKQKEEAHTAALGSALTAGTITGLLTSSFAAIGRGGLEDTFLRGMSFRQVKQITSNVLGRNLGDQTFIEVMKQSLKKVVTKHALVEAPKSFLKSGLDEGFEEGIDEFINSLIVDAYTNQDTPFFERMQQVAHGFVLGFGLGGAGTLVNKAAKNIAPNYFLDRNAAAMVEQEAFKQFERDVEAQGLGDKLRESGSPATAQEAERLVRQYKGAERSEPQSMLASTSVDEDEALGEAAIIIEDQTEEASLEDLEKANYEIQTKLTSEAVRAELANYEAKELLRGNNPRRRDRRSGSSRGFGRGCGEWICSYHSAPHCHTKTRRL